MRCPKALIQAYRAVMWFLSGVSPHVDDQHVLRLEGLLLPGAALPLTHEGLLVAADVLIVQVLKKNYFIFGTSERAFARKNFL